MMNEEITDLVCDFPIKPINDTHCTDMTYGEYFDTLNSSMLVTQVVFLTGPSVALLIFMYRFYYNKSPDARYSLFLLWLGGMGLFICGVDPKGVHHKYVPTSKLTDFLFSEIIFAVLGHILHRSHVYSP